MRPLVLLCLALALVACSDGDNNADANFREADSDMSGTVRIPLMGTAADGTTYRLQGATFEISGSAMVTLSDTDARGGEELMTPLPPGGYSLFLRPGFQLIAIKPDGSTSNATAELTHNPLAFDVSELGNPSLKLAFRVAGQEIAFGSGGAVRMSRAELDAL